MCKKTIFFFVIFYFASFWNGVFGQNPDTLKIISADTVSFSALPTPAIRDTLKIFLDSLSEVRFTALDSVGCAPLTVRFVNQFNDPLSRFIWEFGDGETATLENPQHTYLKPGIYSVKQRIYVGKDSLVGIKEDFIHVYSPILPNFSAPETCICENPATVNFLNLSRAAENYHWHFPGGDPATYEGFVPPDIRYDTPGSYAVTLVTSNGVGCMDTLTRPDFIQAGSKIAWGTTTAKQSACPPFAVMFRDSTKGCIAKWDWNFGDGTKHSGMKDPIHIYDKPGVYDVTLSITFKDGCSDSLVQKSYITVGGQNLNASISKKTVCQYETITFTISANGYVIIEPEEGAMKMIGNIRDTGEVNIFYQYKTAGVHFPVFTVIDSGGCISQIPFRDSVVVHPAPRLTFVAEPGFGLSPLKTTLSPSVTASDSIIRFIWLVEDKGDIVVVAAERTPTLTIDHIGRLDVRCITENQWGCTDTFTRKELIAIYGSPFLGAGNPDPIANFSNHPDGGINIQLITQSKETFEIIVTNVEGSLVFKDNILTEGGTKIYTLPILSLGIGVYSIELTSPSGWKKEVSFEKR